MISLPINLNLFWVLKRWSKKRLIETVLLSTHNICFEASIGVLGIQNMCHFTSSNIGYFPFYFQGYGILCSIYGLLSGILNILEN